MFSNADDFLSLEPAELAGPLLLSLEGNDHIVRDNVISHDLLSLSFDPAPMLREKYPPARDNEILFALMEAWQWLEREGFIAPKPASLASGSSARGADTFFVTRRGKMIVTREGFEAYRKERPISTYHNENLLQKGQLHPRIVKKSWPLLSGEEYSLAVFQAFKEVEIAVRTAGNYAETNYGTDLMRKAFNVADGNLTDHNQASSEKQALSDLFAGAIGYYKNPHSHRNVAVTAEEAAEMIILASHLLRIVDLRKQP